MGICRNIVASRLFKRIRSIFLSLLIVLLTGSGCIAAVNTESVLIAEYQQKVSDILDKWTVFRWGTDNLAWLVHYPAELVEPYVQLETARRKLKPQQVEEYRKAFIGELRIGSATAFMLSVHVFGSEPIKLSPISETVLLVDPSGKGIKPISYEKKLDAPMIGLVQGFIFFKKQESQSLKVLIRGLIPGVTTPFVFQRTGGAPVSAVLGEIPIKTGIPIQTETKKNKPSSNKKQEVLIKIPVITEPAKPQNVPPKTVQPKKPNLPVPPLKPEKDLEENNFISEDLSDEPEARTHPSSKQRGA